eukprot:3887498-Amphidinium_carterae.1
MVSERGWHLALCEVVFGPCLDQGCTSKNLGLTISTLFRSRTIRKNDCRGVLNGAITKVSHIVKLSGKGPISNSDLWLRNCRSATALSVNALSFRIGFADRRM